MEEKQKKKRHRQQDLVLKQNFIHDRDGKIYPTTIFPLEALQRIKQQKEDKHD